MNDVTPFETKTSKLGIDASATADGTPVPHVESSIYSIRPDTGSQNVARTPTELVDIERTDEDERPKPRTKRTTSLAESHPKETVKRLDAIPVYAILRNANPVVIRFDIPKHSIEEVTGTKIEEDKLYHIKGSLVGKYDFEMYRMVKGYVHHFVPVEHQHLIQPGKLHDIRIASLKEVPLTEVQRKLVLEWKARAVPWNRIAYRLSHMQPDPVDRPRPVEDPPGPQKKLYQLERFEHADNLAAAFVAESRLQKGDLASPRDRFYFRINNYEYRQRTGLEIEEGATYRITGEIEGVGRFQKKLRSVAAGQHMPIYVPHELKDKMELGKQYKITISSVERIPSVRDSWEKLEQPSNPWTWRELASWIDTEGHIGENGCDVDIAQKDKRVIEEVCSFYSEQGLHPNMLLQKSVGCYHANLRRIDEVAIVIKNIEPYIRTENKKEQIKQFKIRLMAPRKRLHGVVMEARKTLGLQER